MTYEITKTSIKSFGRVFCFNRVDWSSFSNSLSSELSSFTFSDSVLITYEKFITLIFSQTPNPTNNSNFFSFGTVLIARMLLKQIYCIQNISTLKASG